MLVLTRCSSVGRAGGLGPSGRRFEPSHLDKVFVAQLVLEHLTFNEGVTGSNPVGDTKKFSKKERFIPKNGYFCSVKLKQALLAQMVVAVVLHTTGHRFDPCRVYNKGELSNWLAQQTVNLSS